MSVREDQARAQIGNMRRQSAAEQRQAAQAGAAAELHKALAAGACGHAGDVHAAAVARHRDSEAFHLLVAEMTESMAARLDDWLNDPDEQAARPRLIAVAAAMLGTPSAAGSLHGPGRAAARTSASDATARAAWEAETLTGQGPAAHAWSTRSSCVATGQDLMHRWPLLAHAAAGLGVESVLAAPLGYRLGVICAYYSEPITNETAALATADRVAAVLTRVTLRSVLDLGPDLIASPGDHAAVHQATGIIAIQIGCNLDQAHDLLAARAYADGRPLAQTAADVVRGEIRFEPS